MYARAGNSFTNSQSEIDVAARRGSYGSIGRRPALYYDFTKSTLADAVNRGPALSFARATIATYFDSDGVLQTVASGTARLGAHYYDGSNWVNGGYLAEGERTNLHTKSEELNDASWASSATVTANSTVAPDGTTTADTVEDTNGAGFDKLEKDIAVADDSEDHTWSIFILKDNDETRFPEFQMFYTGGTSQSTNVQINTKTGASAERSGTGTRSHRVVDYGTYWRLEITLRNNSSGHTALSCDPHPAVSTTFGTTEAAATGSVVLWGSQLEKASFASSYIPTTIAAVTRSADSLSGTDLSWIDATQGTILTTAYREHVATGSNAFIFYVESEAQASDLPQIVIRGNNSTAQLRVLCNASAGDSASVTLSTEVAETEHKVAMAYAEDDVAATLDGGAISSDNTFDPTTGYDEFHFGDADGSAHYFGFIKSVKYWAYRKSNAELQSIAS